MRHTARVLLTAAVLLHALAAQAEQPSEATARAVAEAVKQYGPVEFSRPGVVRVSPDGDGYRLSVDLARTVAAAIAPWTVKEASRPVVKLGNPAGGLWTFDTSGPFTLAAELVAGTRSSTASLVIASAAVKGMFDPATLFPREVEARASDATLGLRAAQNSVRIGIGNFDLRSATTDRSAGLGDVDAKFSMQDASAILGAFPQPEVKLAADRIDGTYRIGRLDLAGVGAITRFWKTIARGKDVSALSTTERDGLRAILDKHLPALDEVGGSVTARGLSISAADARFSADRLEYLSRWEGLSGKAALVVGMRVANVSVAEGVWPKGLEAVLPEEAALDAKVSGFDLSKTWKDLALLRTEQEYAQLPRDHFSGMMLPDGRVLLDIEEAVARSAFYNVSLKGHVQLLTGATEKVSARFSVTARNLDATVKYLQDNAGTIPVYARFATMALMMKGLGKPGADSTTQWDVVYEDGGQITVNGQRLPF
ncbi:MAG: hypothetical protein KL863_22400 [Rhizobium sp.]|nr:hypothetical protein [Rhizobium sp.]